MRSSYKYAEKKYNDALMALGSVRIGTLHDFRRPDHKAGISDEVEGQKYVHHYFKDTASEKSELDTKALLAFNIVNPDGRDHVTFTDVRFKTTVHVPDCFTHCTSAVASPQVMGEFEGGDTCVEIYRGEEFYHRLTQSLRLLTPVFGPKVELVKYRDRNEQWTGEVGDHPAQIKDLKFAPQYEVRAIWIPIGASPIRPIVINDTRLIEYCRYIDVHNPLKEYSGYI